MKYIFFGSPRFAEIILHGLICADEPPLAIVCNPDRPVGRKKIITPPPVKSFMRDEGRAGRSKEIKIFQPESLSDLIALTPTFSALAPDFFVIAAYAKIIPKSVLKIPRLGSIGVHPSLLPKYRGASPIQSAILAGEPETGVTLYLMDEKMDHGPMLANNKLQVTSDKATYIELHDALADLGAKLLIETLPKFVEGKIKPQAQDETLATFTKKFTTEDGHIAPEDLAAAEKGNAQKTAAIDRKIRALNPDPGAWTMRDGKRFKLLEAKIQNGSLQLIKTQKEGEKPKTAR